MTLTRVARDRLAELRQEIAALTSDDREVRNAAKRKARLARKASLKLSTAPNKREERETDPGFLAYLRRQPCEAAHLGDCSGPIEAAHIRYSDSHHGRNPGMGRKNHDRHCNPLCHHHHHHDQHKRAERAFWDRLGKDAYDTAARHYERYRA
jgi:hypothetical protein